MNARQPLQFLRPYAFAPATCRNMVYSRFFTAAHRVTATTTIKTTRIGSARLLHSSVIRKSKSDRVTAANVEDGSHGDLDGHAKEVERRVQKLKEYDVFHYPRISNPDNRVTIENFQKENENGPDENTSTRAVTLQGRIMSIRRSGSKLAFLDIVQDYKKAQVMVSLGNLQIDDVAIFKRALHPLLRGDFISVAGIAARTKTGQLTLKATELPKLLSPGLAPIPEDLSDDETKIQNRHLDMLVNQQTSDVLRLRSHVIQQIRNFLCERQFMEVQTPILASYAGGAAARPFLTSATEFPEKELALRIAPELWLKRLVVGGMERVFEIGPSFRNEGLDATHNTEFTMCEFYSAYSSLDELIDMTEQFIRDLFEMVDRQVKNLPTIQPPTFDNNNNNNNNNNHMTFKRLEFLPALESRLGIKFPDLSHPDAYTNVIQLLREASSSSSSSEDTTTTPIPEEILTQPSLNKILDHLASTYLESDSSSSSSSSSSSFLFITHHPSCMSPLAKSFLDPQTNQLVSARAELFFRGKELANMYEEENDPSEQRRKFAEQVDNKNKNKKNDDNDDDDEEGTPAYVDESYVRCLEHGLPPTGGWGCGVDRLVMMLSGAQRISDVQYFGNLRNVVSLTQKQQQQ